MAHTQHTEVPSQPRLLLLTCAPKVQLHDGCVLASLQLITGTPNLSEGREACACTSSTSSCRDATHAADGHHAAAAAGRLGVLQQQAVASMFCWQCVSCTAQEAWRTAAGARSWRRAWKHSWQHQDIGKQRQGPGRSVLCQSWMWPALANSTCTPSPARAGFPAHPTAFYNAAASSTHTKPCRLQPGHRPADEHGECQVAAVVPAAAQWLLHHPHCWLRQLWPRCCCPGRQAGTAVHLSNKVIIPGIYDQYWAKLTPVGNGDRSGERVGAKVPRSQATTGPSKPTTGLLPMRVHQDATRSGPCPC